MGRYPFLAYLSQFMTEIAGCYAPSTIDEMHRKLRRVGKDLRRLKQEGRISTDTPQKIGRIEIMELLKDMKARNSNVNTVSKQMGQLKLFLEWCGNPIVGNIQKQNRHTIPKQIVRRFPSLTEKDTLKILSTTEKLSGWRGRIAHFLMAIYIYCGLRMSELRLAHLEDVDVETWTFRVRHPKGEDSWGVKREVYIPEPCRPVVQQFLKERARELCNRGIQQLTPLIPSLSPRGKHDFYTAQGIENIKRWVEKQSGMKFQIRTLRRTYGQLLLDKGVSIDAVSISMGHTTTKTTETHYCRKSDATVRKEIDAAWGNPGESSKTEKCKNNLIESEKYLSGYT